MLGWEEGVYYYYQCGKVDPGSNGSNGSSGEI